MNIRTILITVGAILIGVAAILIGKQVYESRLPFQGSLIEPSPPAIDFSLERANGNTYHLAERKGQVVLIFFGYANCPDVCPSTLADFKTIHRELEDDAEKVDFVFITIDPERDTQENIERYVSAFNSDFIGLSGGLEQLKAIWDGYWVFREKQETETEAGYLMAHTSRVYAIDKFGKLRLTYPFGVSAASMQSDVERLLAE